MKSADIHSEQLLRLARAGHYPALSELLNRYRNYLALLARLWVGVWPRSPVGPDEIAQRTLLEAHRQFARFHGTTEGELVRWVKGILVAILVRTGWLCPGKSRRNTLGQPSVRRMAEPSGGFGQLVPAPKLAGPVDGEPGVRLANLLQTLPQDHREAIVLRQLEGLSFSEVALCLGCSVGHAKRLWIRGLEQLYHRLRVSGRDA